jgi:hypothetical protein
MGSSGSFFGGVKRKRLQADRFSASNAEVEKGEAIPPLQVTRSSVVE